MKVGIGVSTGAEVVCAALVVVEDDGTQTVEYRTVSADSEANADIGDLVASAIELMTSLAPVPAGHGAHTIERPTPDAIAVTYRTPEHYASIRSACSHSHRNIALVPESAAAHAYLDNAGLIARYRSVAIADIGASGTTLSIVDAQSGVVHAAERTDRFGGDVVNSAVEDLLHRLREDEGLVRDDLRDDRGIGSARHRAVKEHLSTHDSATVTGSNGPDSIDRTDFDAMIRPIVSSTAQMVDRLAAQVVDAPEAVVLIGGGAHIPLIRTVFESVLRLPVLSIIEPDTVLAKGAAHVAITAPREMYPRVGSDAATSGRSVGRVSAALVGALVVGGIVLAYALQSLTPTDDSGYSPAGSAIESEQQSVETRTVLDESGDQPRTTDASATAATTSTANGSAGAPYIPTPTSVTQQTPTRIPAASSPTPTLHPAPNLPVIPYPVRPSPPPTSQAPDTTTDAPPSQTPGVPETSTPAAPSESPTVPTEIQLPPTTTPTLSVPTTDVAEVPAVPELTAPPTVWSPPVPSEPATGAEPEAPTPSESAAPAQSVEPVRPVETSPPVESESSTIETTITPTGN